MLTGLAREVFRQLEREPDTGDLLLALACAADTLPARILAGLELDPRPSVS